MEQKTVGRMGSDMLDNFARGTIVIEDLEIGMTRHLHKQVTERDIELFAEVSTDRNPVHLDDAYARASIFEGRIAQPRLDSSLRTLTITVRTSAEQSVVVAVRVLIVLLSERGT